MNTPKPFTARSRPPRVSERPESLWLLHRRAKRADERTDLYAGLSVLLSCGATLQDALESQRRAAGSARRRRLLDDLRIGVTGGRSLADAMQRHPEWFDRTDIALVRNADRSGGLAVVLARLETRRRQIARIRSDVLRALAYPTLIACVGAGVGLFLSLHTLPRIADLLTRSAIEVPALTRGLIMVGAMLVQHGGPVAIVLVLVMLGLTMTCRRTSLGDRFVPRAWRQRALADLSLSLADLLRAGIPLVPALVLVTPTLTDGSLRAQLTNATAALREGTSLAIAFRDETWFDDEYRRVLDLGESTGALDSVLERIGSRYERRSARSMQRLTTFLEPLALLVVTVFVGVVVMATILPITRLQEMVR